MVALAEIKALNFQYALAEKKSLIDLSFLIQSGDFIVLAGASGSGKTTLLRQLKKELWPVGERSGAVFFLGSDLTDLSPKVSAQKIGMVFQDPDNQLAMDTVIQELAFSLENIGIAEQDIMRRIAEMVSFLGFQDLLHRDVHSLSGGQKQLVNLAAVLILQPTLLLLDEPTAQLDPIAAKEFMGLLKRIHDELGITVVISEHQLDDVLPLATKMILMAEGCIIFEGSVQAGLQMMHQDERLQVYVPEIPRLLLTVKPTVGADLEKKDLALNVTQGRHFIASQHLLPQATFKSEKAEKVNPSALILTAKQLDFQYEKNGELILDDLEIRVQRGEWLTIIGKNGTGKSTLLRVLAGLELPRKGQLKFLGKSLSKINPIKRYAEIGYLSQKPGDHFSFDSVEAELLNRATQLELPDALQAVQDMLERLKITNLSKQNPHDTSGGEQQLIALGLVLLSQPKLLILDEPTKGLDPERKLALGRLLKELQNKGMTMVMASHDMAFSARFSSRCGLLFDGQLVALKTPRLFFSENFFYTTVINRLIRPWLSQALNDEDVTFND